MKDFLIISLFFCMPLAGFADGEGSINDGEEAPSEEVNWPQVVFTSTADGTNRNILPGTEVRVEVKLITDATNYKWLWDNGSDSVYIFKADDNVLFTDAYEKKIELTLTDSVGNVKRDTVSFKIWPFPEIDDDATIEITDVNNPKNTELLYIREGNQIRLKHPRGHGGFDNGWNYIWTIDGKTLNHSNPSIPYGLSYVDGNVKTNVNFTIQNVCGDSVWFTATFHHPIIIFQQPVLPTYFTKKGDGTTGTWILKSNQKQIGDLKVALKKDSLLEDLFVVRCDSILAANEDYWWFHSDYVKEHKEIDEANLCIYAERYYGDSIRITSNLLMLNAKDNILWDDSSYSTDVIESESDDETPNNEGDEKKTEEKPDDPGQSNESRMVMFNVNGGQTNRMHRGLNLVRMEDGIVRKVIIR